MVQQDENSVNAAAKGVCLGELRQLAENTNKTYDDTISGANVLPEIAGEQMSAEYYDQVISPGQTFQKQEKKSDMKLETCINIMVNSNKNCTPTKLVLERR